MKYSAKTIWYFQKLNQRVKVGKSRAIFRVAAYIRTSAKRSMRLRSGPSQAPAPPHAHTKAGLRAIEFAVDPSLESAIVGPVKFPGSNFFDSPVPHIHEFGGSYLARTGIYQYPQRPYMSTTLKRLHASGVIPRQYSASLAEVL